MINNLTLTSTNTVSQINGIYLAGGDEEILNNMISLGPSNSNPNAIYGIYEAAGGNTIYYNSVYVGGTTSGTTGSTYAFNSAVSSGTRYYYNNIFENAESGGSGGIHYAFTTGGFTNLISDYNIYYVTGSNTKLFDNGGTDYTTWASWQAAIQAVTSANDVHSGVGIPNFIAPPGHGQR